MSQTRILCPTCGFPQIHCTCSPKFVHPSTPMTERSAKILLSIVEATKQTGLGRKAHTDYWAARDEFSLRALLKRGYIEFVVGTYADFYRITDAGADVAKRINK